MTIDVVIVTYGSAAVLGPCLDAAERLDRLGRVIVVDHGDDASGELARSRGATVTVDVSNPGYGAGQNRGRALSTAPYVLMLNPDAEIDPAGVARGAALLDASPDVAMVQGVVDAASGTGPERTAGRALAPVHLWGRALGLRPLLQVGIVRKLAGRRTGLADHVHRAPDAPTDVDALAAVAVLARREALDAVGGFDDARFFLYGEDMDLSRRLRDAGWRLVTLPDRWARHLSGASSASSWERELEWWRGTLAYAMRWWSAPARASAWAAAFVMTMRLIGRRPRDARRALALLR